MITSSALVDCSVAMAMISPAQWWCGSSIPFNMLSADELHLLEPLDATAPLAARMFHELRRLGCKVAACGPSDRQQQATKRSTAHTCERLALQATPKRRLRGLRNVGKSENVDFSSVLICIPRLGQVRDIQSGTSNSTGRSLFLISDVLASLLGDFARRPTLGSQPGG